MIFGARRGRLVGGPGTTCSTPARRSTTPTPAPTEAHRGRRAGAEVLRRVPRGSSARRGPGRARTTGAAAALRALFAAAFAARTRAEWPAVFAGSDACVAPVLSLARRRSTRNWPPAVPTWSGAACRSPPPPRGSRDTAGPRRGGARARSGRPRRDRGPLAPGGSRESKSRRLVTLRGGQRTALARSARLAP